MVDDRDLHKMSLLLGMGWVALSASIALITMINVDWKYALSNFIALLSPLYAIFIGYVLVKVLTKTSLGLTESKNPIISYYSWYIGRLGMGLIVLFFVAPYIWLIIFLRGM